MIKSKKSKMVPILDLDKAIALNPQDMRNHDYRKIAQEKLTAINRKESSGYAE
jgi:hypothetical protein